MLISAGRKFGVLVGLAFLATGWQIPSTALADYTITVINLGVSWDTLHGGGSIATSSPGTAFVIDYTPYPVGAAHDDIASVLLAFDCQTPFTTADIVLDSSPTVFSFAPTAPSTSEFAMLLFDPAYLTGSGNVPTGMLPQAWKDELADGTLSGRIWVEGTPFQPQFAMLAALTAFVVGDVPEPATMTLLTLGGLAMLRRRKMI